MKKIIYLFVISIFVFISGHAQPMMVYDVEASCGSYEEITGGTIIGSAIQGNTLNGVVFDGSNYANKKKVTSAGFPIGFDFKFNNKMMNQFSVAANGYLVLGNGDITVNPSVPFQALGSSTNVNVVGATSIGEIYGIPTTELSYKVIGEEPNRTLVVQYKDLGLTDRLAEDPVDTAQLQFRLHETTGKIDIVFKHWQTGQESNSYMLLKIGIKGSLNNDRQIITSSTDSYTDISTSTNGDNSIKWINTCYPQDGQTYTFTPPADCGSPTGQPTNLKIFSSSTQINGIFDKYTDADHYLTLISKSESLKDLPVNDQFYSVKDSIGDAQVVSYDTTATFKTAENLTGGTKYYIHVFGVNSLCMFGPKYNTKDPLTSGLATMPVSPNSLNVIDVDTASIKINVKGNPEGNKVLIAETTEPTWSDDGGYYDGTGVFGQPAGTYNIGDSIPGGGHIIYNGAENDDIPVNNLKDNTLYYIQAWSYDNEGNYSTTCAPASLLTSGKVPYIPDFSKMLSYSAPTGWNVTGGLFRLERDLHLSCAISRKNSSSGLINSIESPWIYLSEGLNRVLMDINMTQYVNRTTSPYNSWEDDDSLYIQVSNDGKTYYNIKSIGAGNAPKFATKDTYVTLYAPFNMFSGKKVKIRLYWHCYAAATLNVENIKVEHKNECDYPIYLEAPDSTIIGDHAQIIWKSQGEEDTWEIRYKKSSESTWCEPITTNKMVYTLGNLPTQSDMDVQVRSRCSETSCSEWSKTLTFHTGYGVPFMEKFDESALPIGWLFKTGAVSDSTTFETGEDMAPQWGFTSSSWAHGVFLSPRGDSADEWLITPSLNLGSGSTEYIFNYGLTTLDEGSSTDETYHVVISTDNGKTFSKDNILKTFTKSDFPETNSGKTYSVSLKGYKEMVRLAIYVNSTDGVATNVQMDSIYITSAIPTSINDISNTDLSANVKNGVLNIYNANKYKLRRIELLTVSGQLIASYTVNTENNLSIPLNNLHKSFLIVKIISDVQTIARKVSIR